jgi:DNA helicase-2/ATP-dependent DNA helicase PcrA
MLRAISITEEDIAFAEAILLPEGKIFDDERRAFIKNFETIDLQAVPGSGKTTALLAKLLILERKLPFDDGSGILVISHTNAAVDEIKDKIQKYCPKLFSYPNFIGTIQSFVDDFLAIPFGLNYLGVKINCIDKERFEEEIINKFSEIKWLEEYGRPQGLFFAKHFQRAILELIDFSNYALTKKELEGELKKHSRARTKTADLITDLNRHSKSTSTIITIKAVYSKIDILTNNDLRYAMLDFEKEIICDYNEDLIIGQVNAKNQVNEKYEGLKKVIDYVLKKGIISYRFAYLLAKNQLHYYPKSIELLQKRFSYVFVDEMQDMDAYQYDLLERIFFDQNKSISKYQRIGDKNQSIYNGNAKDVDYWSNREIVLPLNGSQRLTPAIANVVNNFALFQSEGSGIIGLGDSLLKPYIIKYSTTSIQNVIPKYLELIKRLQAGGHFPLKPKHPIKIISWNSTWKTEQEKNNPDNVRLVDYHTSFSRAEHKLKVDYSSLKAYLYYFDKKKKTLEPIRKSILNAFLKILRLESVLNPDCRYFTKKQLIEAIKGQSINLQIDIYTIFKQNLYNWSIEIIRGKYDEVYKLICNYIPSFLEIFEKQINNSREFIIATMEIVDGYEESKVSNNNLKLDELEIEVTTVHAAKGQTHSATLYLESSYYGQHETERLNNQLLGKAFNDKRVYHKQSTKMAYVGFSRPTDLLCLAVHEDRYMAFLNTINLQEWEVVVA